VNAAGHERERRAARRRTLRVLVERRLAVRRQALAPTVLAQASISSTGRMPTDS
jgi:hypothetical protein